MFAGTLGRIGQGKASQQLANFIHKSALNMSRGALVTFSWRPADPASSAGGEGGATPPSTVEIAGTFTEWKPVAMVAPSTHNTDNTLPSPGYWTLDRHLEPGEHQYKYVVDGKWIHDEKKETKENEMGSKNNVIRIEDYPGSEKLSEGLDDDVDGDADRDSQADTDSLSGRSSDGDDMLDDEDDEDDGVGGDWEVLDKPGLTVTPPIGNGDSGTGSSSTHSSIEVIGNDNNSRGSSKVSNATSPKNPPSLEVERKFVVPADYRDRLVGAGFEPVGNDKQEVLADSYYDFSTRDNSFPLLTNDHWLRQRNGDWELKYPVGQSTSTAPNSMTSSTMSTNEDDVINCANPTTQTTPSAGTTLYHETSNLEDILSKIRAIVQPSSLKNYSNEAGNGNETGIDNGWSSAADLNSMVESRQLTTFATLETNRKWFKRPEDNVSVVVDETDWGYMIGEIEVMIDSKRDLTNALLKIDQLATSLDFTRLDLISFTRTAEAQ